jgi:hypothetical protein
LVVLLFEYKWKTFSPGSGRNVVQQVDLLANKNDLLANKNDLLANKNDLLANKSLMRDLGCEGKSRIFKSKFIFSACIQFMMKGIRLFIYSGRIFSTFETEDGPVVCYY